MWDGGHLSTPQSANQRLDAAQSLLAQANGAIQQLFDLGVVDVALRLPDGSAVEAAQGASATPAASPATPTDDDMDDETVALITELQQRLEQSEGFRATERADFEARTREWEAERQSMEQRLAQVVARAEAAMYGSTASTSVTGSPPSQRPPFIPAGAPARAASKPKVRPQSSLVASPTSRSTTPSRLSSTATFTRSPTAAQVSTPVAAAAAAVAAPAAVPGSPRGPDEPPPVSARAGRMFPANAVPAGNAANTVTSPAEGPLSARQYPSSVLSPDMLHRPQPQPRPVSPRTYEAEASRNPAARAGVNFVKSLRSPSPQPAPQRAQKK